MTEFKFYNLLDLGRTDKKKPSYELRKVKLQNTRKILGWI